MRSMQTGEGVDYNALYTIAEVDHPDGDIAIIDGINGEILSVADRLHPGKMATVDFLYWVVTSLAEREHSVYGDGEGDNAVSADLIALAQEINDVHGYA
jgi:hypothetical protein